MLLIGVVALAGCNGDDDEPEMFGRAEAWVGGGDVRMLNLEPGTAAHDLRLPVISDPSMLRSESEAGIRGIGVGQDGTIVFEFGGRLHRVNPEGEVDVISTTSPNLMDAAIEQDGEVLGAPWFPGGEALVRLRDGEWDRVGLDETLTEPDEGRLTVAPDGSALRTIAGHGLLKVGSDDSVTEVPVETECSRTDLIGVAADGDSTWVGYQTCGPIVRVSSDGSASNAVSERADPSYCRGEDEVAFTRSLPTTLLAAYGLAVDSGGRLWIADPYCGTLEYLEDGELVDVSRDIADVVAPIDLGFDGDGNLYVLDAGRQAVLRVVEPDLPRPE